MPPSELRLAGGWIPKDLVDNLEADCKVLPSDHPYSVVSSEGLEADCKARRAIYS